MKKLLLLFVLVLSFTACTDFTPDTGNNDVQPAVKPLEYTETAQFTQLPQPQLKQLEKYVESLSPRDLLGILRLEQLAEKGITVKIEHPQLKDVSMVNFDIVLENSQGKTAVLPVSALLNYNSDSNGLRNIEVIWGNISADEENLIVTMLNNIYKLDIDTLSVQQLQPEFLTDGQQQYYLLDVISCDAGYTASCLGQTRQGIVVFDENGKTVSENLEFGFLGGTDSDISRNYSIRLGHNHLTTFYINPQQTILGFTSDETVYAGNKTETAPLVNTLADLSTDAVEYYPYTAFDYTSGDYRFTMFSPGNYNTFRAVRAKNGKVTDYFTFDGSQLHETFRQDYNDEYSISSAEDGNIVTVYSPYSSQTLEINFKDYTVNIYNQYTEDWEYEVFDTSKDGRFELCTGSRYGGGDVSHSRIVLRDTQTGQMKYIDTIGGMYGGSESAGFFSNGDVYTIGLDEFKVFTNNMEQTEPVFEMSKNFPLGDDAVGKGSFRHLLAARRNPDDFSWIVLYNEAPYKEQPSDWYMDGDLGYNFYKSTYKVGILDPQGNLTRVYDTGEYVMTYDFRRVNMYLSADNMLNFKVVIKGTETQLHGQLNLNTGEYTCVSGGYNRWN